MWFWSRIYVRRQQRLQRATPVLEALEGACHSDLRSSCSDNCPNNNIATYTRQTSAIKRLPMQTLILMAATFAGQVLPRQLGSKLESFRPIRIAAITSSICVSQRFAEGLVL